MSVESTPERLDPWRAAALRDLLEVEAEVAPGSAVPLLWHWIFLLDHPTHRDLGPDGHRNRAPEDRALRRMWAGGRVTQRGRLALDRPARRESREIGRETKVGRSGTFDVLTIGHRVLQDGRVVVEEEQNLVLRPPASAQTPDPGVTGPALRPTPGERSWPVDERFLFRYSALTYNGHRIHYDRPYATSVEGYAGLVVHGPLQALLMAEDCTARHNPDRVPATFSYRLLAPLVDGEGLVTAVDEVDDGWTTTVRDRSGRRTASGTYRLLRGDDTET